MATLTMMRTVCCEAHKQCGRRCAICPNRPENQEALLNYKQNVRSGFARLAYSDCEISRDGTITHAQPSAESRSFTR